MAPKKIIIDTDPGVDDVLAILLALSASPDELEVLLISVTFGNIDVISCARNVVAIFHVLQKELEWRKTRVDGLKSLSRSPFTSLDTFRPIVAIGAEVPLLKEQHLDTADYFHGRDGLAGIHTSHPHLSPEENWRQLFQHPTSDSLLSRTARAEADLSEESHAFTPSRQPSHKEILRLLRENEPDTISLVAIGPLTNCALAAAEDPETFLRLKEIVSMGGAVDVNGNVTPVAEFNVFADPYAAARVYALTSANPASTLPPLPGAGLDPGLSDALNLDLSSPVFQPYPDKLSRRLNLSLMALDITESHLLHRSELRTRIQHALNDGSPLAHWVSAFMEPMLAKIADLDSPPESGLIFTADGKDIVPTPAQAEGVENDGEAAIEAASAASDPRVKRELDPALALHDPLCVWYLLTHHDSKAQSSRAVRAEQASPSVITSSPVGSVGWEADVEDIRVETVGTLTRGMTLRDRRNRQRRNSHGDVPHDRGNWLGNPDHVGNRVRRFTRSPGERLLTDEILTRLFGRE